MLSTALRSYLTTHAEVQALVEDRVYHILAPLTATYPLVQFQTIASRRLPVLDGPHLIKGPRVQIDYYAQKSVPVAMGYGNSETHVDEVEQAAAALERAMESFRGVYGTVEVLGCLLESERELPDPDGTLARVSQDYQIWWRALP